MPSNQILVHFQDGQTDVAVSATPTLSWSYISSDANIAPGLGQVATNGQGTYIIGKSVSVDDGATFQNVDDILNGPIIWDGSRFLQLTSTGYPHWSLDGLEWQTGNVKVSNTAPFVSGIGFFDGYYVTVDSNGWVWYTNNHDLDTNWTIGPLLSLSSSDNPIQFAWNDSILIVFSATGSNAYWTENITSWTAITWTGSTGSIRSMAWEGSEWIAGCDDETSPSNASVWANSSDGKSWTRNDETSWTRSDISSVWYDGSYVYAVGSPRATANGPWLRRYNGSWSAELTAPTQHSTSSENFFVVGYPSPETLNGISGTVFDDADADGVLDLAESGVSGIDVLLYDNAATPALLATSTTDSLGRYAFPGLADATYNLELDTDTLPTNWSTTSSTTAQHILSAGELGTTNFGIAECTVTVHCYYDEDGDGVKDVGDTYNSVNYSPDPTVVLKFDSDENGSYETTINTLSFSSDTVTFTDLLPGDYRIEFAVPANHEMTSPAYYEFTLAVGQDEDKTFLFTNSSLTGKVWNDSDGDGVLDGGETSGFGSITITLYKDADLNGSYETLIGSTNTNGSGVYSFSNLTSGNYRIVVDEADLTGRYLTTVSPLDITISPGEDATGKNFGATYNSSIFGSVFHDIDLDGTLDGGETGSGYDTIELNLYLDSDNNGSYETFVSNIVCASNGTWSYTSAEVGSYRIILDETTLPSGFVPSVAGYLDFTISSGGSSVLNRNIGIVDGVGISGIVFDDLSHNGLKGGSEPGVAGIDVILWNSTQTVEIDRITTTSTGTYNFSGLAPGTYVVQVDQLTFPANYIVYSVDNFTVVLTEGEVESRNFPIYDSTAQPIITSYVGFRSGWIPLSYGAAQG